MAEEYLTMKELGAERGRTSHEVGKALKKAGYRTESGKPSRTAFAEEMVEQRWDDHGHYVWAWHAAKTRLVLDRMGLVPKSRTATK